jgi:hypothetical protein
MDLVSLALVNYRAESDLLLGGIANRQLSRGRRQTLDISVGEALVYEMATGSHTDLTLVKEGAPCTGRHRTIEVGVIQDYESAVASELEMDPLEVFGAELAHGSSSGG